MEGERRAYRGGDQKPHAMSAGKPAAQDHAESIADAMSSWAGAGWDNISGGSKAVIGNIRGATLIPRQVERHHERFWRADFRWRDLGRVAHGGGRQRQAH